MIETEELQKARILVVDDQPQNVLLLEKMLKAAGYAHVDGVADPRRVEPLCREHRFDLVLLDLNMPHLDGFEVLAQLRRLGKERYVPVVVLTAQTDHESRIRALEGGARDFLTKPFDRVEVLTRIRNLIEARMLHKEVLRQNEALEERVRDRTMELLDTRMEIIRRLGRAAEYRDNETGLHIVRMATYSARLARAAGMSAAECELLLGASMMHDIGKIGIPDRILLKPGKLDPEEFEVIKTHPEIGAEILSGHHSDIMELAQKIALTHHEKWNGGGYPHGRQGEAIPFPGRIVAICDVFDALTTERPYKKAWPVDRAVALLREESGAHFDAGLVRIFTGILPEILQIRSKYAEPDGGEAAAPESLSPVREA